VHHFPQRRMLQMVMQFQPDPRRGIADSCS
jgi:hypothetical protein